MRKLSHAFYLLVAIFIFTSWAGDAFAAGYYSPGAGIRVQGRGGASVLGATTGRTIWHNPANISNLKGTQLDFEFGISKPFIEWESTVPDLEGKVSNEASPFPIPSLFITSDFGLDWHDLVFGAAIYAPYGGMYKYPEDGPQRYSIIESSIKQIIYEIAVAMKPIKNLRLGASFAMNQMSTQMFKAVSANPMAENRDFFFDTAFDVKDDMQVQGWVPNWSAGIVYKIPFDDSPKPLFLEFGGSVRGGFTFNGEGDQKVEFIEEVASIMHEKKGDPTPIDRAGLSITTKMPYIIKGGLRFGKEDLWDIELDAYYEMWSCMDYATIYPDTTYFDIEGLSDDIPMPEVIKDKRLYTDSLGLFLGGEYKINDWVRVRAGGGWQQGSIPNSTYNVQLIDRDKIIGGLGATFSFWIMDIDVMGSYQYMGSFEITPEESEYKVLAIQLPDDMESAPQMASGHYKSFMPFAGVGFVFHFDELWTDQGEQELPKPTVKEAAEKAPEKVFPEKE